MGVWERSPASRADRARPTPATSASFRDARCPTSTSTPTSLGSAYSVRRFVVDERLGGREGLAAARAELRRPRRRPPARLRAQPRRAGPPVDAGAPRVLRARRPTASRLRRRPRPVLPAVGRHGAARTRSRRRCGRAAADTVLDIADQCDGVRCDMAMLLLNHVFAQTWGERVGLAAARPSTGPTSSAPCAPTHPGFVFMAEAYWDLECELQQLGFDFCYDKRLYDRLVARRRGVDPRPPRRRPGYQSRLLRFIENHDEPRAAAASSPTGSGPRRSSSPRCPARRCGTRASSTAAGSACRSSSPAAPRSRSTGAAGVLRAARRHRRARRRVGAAATATGWPDNHSAEHLLAWTWTDGDEPRAGRRELAADARRRAGCACRGRTSAGARGRSPTCLTGTTLRARRRRAARRRALRGAPAVGRATCYPRQLTAPGRPMLAVGADSTRLGGVGSPTASVGSPASGRRRRASSSSRPRRPRWRRGTPPRRLPRRR